MRRTVLQRLLCTEMVGAREALRHSCVVTSRRQKASGVISALRERSGRDHDGGWGRGVVVTGKETSACPMTSAGQAAVGAKSSARAGQSPHLGQRRSAHAR